MPLPYKTLVLCFDGTWNDLSSHTNVSRLHSEVTDVSTGCPDQIKFYDQGVGTGKWDRIRGGAFGLGLDDNIRAGYAWLASVYQCEADTDPTTGEVLIPPPPATVARKPNGDLLGMKPHPSGSEFLAGSDVLILGFSRGAFTARSLGGLINYLGVPRIDPRRLKKEEHLSEHPTIAAAWKLYLERPKLEVRDRVDKKTATREELAQVAEHDATVKAFRADGRYPVRIHFMGVWDTVGALGVPPIFGVWNNPMNKKYTFHDTTLGACIRHAYHAMAIDEHRLPYAATLWTGKPKPTTESVEQRWFPGAHADVGGGYPADLLHELPLNWLAKKAASFGLEFVNDRHIAAPDGTVPASIAMAPASFDLDGTEYLSPVHDSYSEFMGGVYKVLRSIRGGRAYRRILVPSDGLAQKIDESAFEKWRMDSNYRPPNLAQAGRADVSYSISYADAIDWGQA
jgi:uncharacterized protein (DUF2235 family)